MTQSKKFSLIEATTNTAIGFVIALCTQLVIYPVMGIVVSIQENIIITAVFTAVSILRGYIIRRLFNKLKS